MVENQGVFLLEPTCIELIRKYNMTYPACGVAGTPDEAAEIARHLGFPVVTKIISPDIVHKSDIGGVKIGLQDSTEVVCACENMMRAIGLRVPDAILSGFLVCKQADPGLEIIIGAKEDPEFGMAIMFGLGGIYTEVYEDVIFRMVPIKKIDAEEMIQEIKGYPVLRGVRGQSGSDLKTLIEILLNISRMLIENKEISEMDLNPIRVQKQGLMVLDVRIFKRN